MLSEAAFKRTTSLTHHEWYQTVDALRLAPSEQQLLFDAFLAARSGHGWNVPTLSSRYKTLKFLHERVEPLTRRFGSGPRSFPPPLRRPSWAPPPRSYVSGLHARTSPTFLASTKRRATKEFASSTRWRPRSKGPSLT